MCESDEAESERLLELGVVFRSKLTVEAAFTSAVFEGTCGNLIQQMPQE